MADQLLDLTGLAYFKQQCDATYLTDADLADKPSIHHNEYGVCIGNNHYEPSGVTYYDLSVYSADHYPQGTVHITYKTESEWRTIEVPSVGAMDLIVPVRTVKVNGVTLTPDAQKAVNVQTATVTIGVDSSTQAQTYANMYGVTRGIDSYAKFSRTANGVNFETAIDDSGATTSINVNLPDEARVEAMIAAAQVGVTWDIVTDLPATGSPGKMYLKGPVGSGTNIYEEWIWINSGTSESPNWHWENIGTTAIDLSGYLQKTDIELITTAQIDALFT